jgi:hypothetical protein
MRFWSAVIVALSLLLPIAAKAQSILVPQSSTAIEGSHVFCQGPCKLYSASVTTGSTAGFFMIFDANSVPADGALVTAPKYCWNFPASTGQGYTWLIDGGNRSDAPSGAQFLNGLTVVFSTGADCLHKTLSATAFFTVQVQ